MQHLPKKVLHATPPYHQATARVVAEVGATTSVSAARGMGRLSTKSAAVVISVPITIVSRYRGRFVTTFGMGKTKTPPCGTRSSQPKSIDNAPVTAEPMIHDGITLNGSSAANGIAPS